MHFIGRRSSLNRCFLGLHAEVFTLLRKRGSSRSDPFGAMTDNRSEVIRSRSTGVAVHTATPVEASPYLIRYCTHPLSSNVDDSPGQ